MPRYKRTFDEAELDIPLEPAVEAENVETLGKLRNMWEFASLMQYIYLFGHVVKIENDFDIEVCALPKGCQSSEVVMIKENMMDADAVSMIGS